MQYNELHELTTLLREHGDKILDASSKLSLSTHLLHKMNESFMNVIEHDSYSSSFQVLGHGSTLFGLDLQLLYDFVQKALALKILHKPNIISSQVIDINVFHNLKLLEVHRFSLNLLKGLKSLRTQLQYLTCMRSVNTLREVLEICGADNTQGYVWSELKEAVFCHNGLDNLDTSLEFVPQLKSIDLSHNRIQDVQSLNCLLNLKYLNLGFNKIENVPAFSGQLCNTLQVLILCNNYIEDIKELSILIQLHELDLSNNCLVEHGCLAPLTNLTSLQKLRLSGNPLSYHPQHRKRTVRYLHVSTSTCFLLDNSLLSKSELRLLGSLHSTFVALERSASFNSTTTSNTVVPCVAPFNQNSANIENGTTEVSCNQLDAQDVSQLENDNVGHDFRCMQDSGFVAGPRPVSPSECSIESTSQGTTKQVIVVAEIHSVTNLEPCSATSLDEMNEKVTYCESDIEVLSNPSQSSIEVLSNRSGPRTYRYVQSASAILTQPIHEMSTKNNLKEMTDEMHRSF